MPDTILIVDDEPAILSTLSAILTDEGYRVQTAEEGEGALQKVQADSPDLVLLDVWMQQSDGLDVLKKMKVICPEIVVIVMSGHGSIETAVKAIKRGAYDYIEKPLSMEKVLLMLQHALTELKLRTENRQLTRFSRNKREMIGVSQPMMLLREQIKMAANSQSRVFISGENGTGKEMVARMIHQGGARRERPLLEVNCAAIPESLIESELFGYERGAFTGAQNQYKGKFEQADGGTLFLDEVADMSLATQAKVLSVLQNQTFCRLGGGKQIEVDVRILTASNKNLTREIEQGSFREDLYYRLNVIPLNVPPLRKRTGDLPLFLAHFMREVAEEQGMRQKGITPEAVSVLENYRWPGNVRELINVIERFMIMTPSLTVTASALPDFLTEGARGTELSDGWPVSLKEARAVFERKHILTQLTLHRWEMNKTAKSLGIERTHLWRKMKALGIDTAKEGE